MDRPVTTLSPLTHSRLVLPRASLSACVRAVMLRNTLGAALTDRQRLNHLPSTPMCSLSWWFEGEALLLPPDALHAPDLAAVPRTPLPLRHPMRCLFAGPITQPLVSWNPGPVHAMLVLLPPDAVHHLTGLDVTAWVNRWADAADVLPPDWILACAQVAAPADDDDTRIRRLEDFLDPRWQAERPPLPMHAHRYLDWAQSLAMHAAATGPGRSLRQMERRIKRWSGLPMRELRGLGRAEQAFFEALAQTGAGAAGSPVSAPNWAEVADASGYADQSHLCRETRRVTGFSPDELYRRIHGDESFWAYRLWQ